MRIPLSDADLHLTPMEENEGKSRFMMRDGLTVGNLRPYYQIVGGECLPIIEVHGVCDGIT